MPSTTGAGKRGAAEADMELTGRRRGAADASEKPLCEDDVAPEPGLKRVDPRRLAAKAEEVTAAEKEAERKAQNEKAEQLW